MVRLILVRHGRTTANSTGVLAGRTAVELDDHGRTQAEALAEVFATIPLAVAISSPLLRTQQTAELLLAKRDPALQVQLDEGFTEVDYGEWTGAALKDLAGDPLWRVVQSHPSAVTFPQGESMAAMSARAVGAVRRWVAQVAPAPEDAAADQAAADNATPKAQVNGEAVSPQEPNAQQDGESGTGQGGTGDVGPGQGGTGDVGTGPPRAAQPSATAEPAAKSPPPTPNLLVVSHGDVIKAILADALGLHLDAFQRICVDPASVSVVHYGPTRPMVECMNTDGSLLRTWNHEAPATGASVPGGGAGR